ncbi:hypothetical protein E1263_16075 [Kribbella antibiotica]|uniref:Uncharacterized protein n=1 Tax=Kribbella antibiotica TaxID=190195 RepID=A0A4R4ZN66_9ACTN|nr:hypothetical protein [Kribbella antibiotica]TDD59169.1 hypothetical protein E1263_16075 [Kribbella antibiotica]
MEPIRPFRWDLIRPDQLGSLLDDVEVWELFFLDDLIRCAARVLGQCGNGELYFVGRSVDSLFDLLSGALDGTEWSSRLHPLPLSMARSSQHQGEFSAAEIRQLRTNLAASGLAPADLMRGRPTVFVDLVSGGGTFERLYAVLRQWIDDEHAQWDVIRRQLKFVGITGRRETSPNTFRWQQQANFAHELPASAIRNVSLDRRIWSYFGDYQHKTARSFRRNVWADPEAAEPRRDGKARLALAEAVRVVAAGRTPEVRRKLAGLLTREPAIKERWLRELQVALAT